MVKVQVAILSYNEAKNFPDVVKDVIAGLSQLPEVEPRIVIVDNGSVDNTQEVIAALKQKYAMVDSVRVAKNLGYGYGIKQGLAALDGDIVGYMWGDNQFDASIVADLVAKFLADPHILMAKTNRVKRYDGKQRLYVSKFYQLIFRILYGSFTEDINSGPKLFRAEFLKELLPLRSNDWFIDAEIMIKTSRKINKSAIVELPIEFNERKFGKSNVRLKDCFQFLFNLIQYRFKRF